MTIFRDIIIHVKHQPVNTKAEKIMIIPYLLAFFKYVIYGSSVFFTSSINENADVLDILALRFLMSLVVMWLLKTAKVIKMDLGVKEIFTKGRRSQFIPCLLLAALFELIFGIVLEREDLLLRLDQRFLLAGFGFTYGIVYDLERLVLCTAQLTLVTLAARVLDQQTRNKANGKSRDTDDY